MTAREAIQMLLRGGVTEEGVISVVEAFTVSGGVRRALTPEELGDKSKNHGKQRTRGVGKRQSLVTRRRISRSLRRRLGR